MTRVILIGGGSSLKEGISHGLWDHIASEKVWSCNYGYRTMPYLPSREIWVDVSFYKHNIEELQKLCEQGVSLYTKEHRFYAGIKEHITQYGSTRESKNYFGKDGINKNLIYYGRMGLSGMFALSLAVAEGYTEIYLLGYDFGNTNLQDKQTHFYQDTLKNVYSTGVGRPEVYRMPNNTIKREVEDFKVYLRESDVKIYNCSLQSNISYFEKISYPQFFERLKHGK